MGSHWNGKRRGIVMPPESGRTIRSSFCMSRRSLPCAEKPKIMPLPQPLGPGQGSFTTFLQNAKLDLIFGGVPFTPPDTYYLGLSLAPARVDGTYREPQGASYRRVPIPRKTGFTPVREGQTANRDAIVFPIPQEPWGRILSLFLADDQNRVYMVSNLTMRLEVDEFAVGSFPPTVAPGALFIQDT